jgi:hypothetical protein
MKDSMKRLLVLLLVFSLLFVFCSCSSGRRVERLDDEDEKSDHRWFEDNDDIAPTEKTEATTEPTQSTKPSETAEPREPVRPTQVAIIGEVSLPEQLIYDQDNIVVNVTGMAWDNDLGPEIKVSIENNGTTDVMIIAQWSSINGAMVDLMLSGQMIAAGKKANEGIMIYASDLELAGIEVIKDIEFRLVVMDDQMSTISSSPVITLTTVGSEDYTQVFEPIGDVVLDQDGIKISFGDPVESPDFDGINLPILMENNSGNDVTIEFIDTSVNDYMLDFFFHALVLDGNVAYKNIFLSQSDLDENNIDIVEKLEFKVVSFDPDNWGEYILDSKLIIVTYE